MDKESLIAKAINNMKTYGYQESENRKPELISKYSFFENLDKKYLDQEPNEFARVRTSSFYVDKTLFIKSILEDGAFCKHFQLPFGFGKTVNLHMLRDYFRGTNRDLFKDTNIEKQHAHLFQPTKSKNEYCREEFGTHPVIFLDFNKLVGGSPAEVENLYAEMMSKLYLEFMDMLVPLMDSPYDLQDYLDILSKTTSFYKTDVHHALERLIKLICKLTSNRPVLLIDNHDAPLRYAYQYGFYKQVNDYLGNVLRCAIKDSCDLHMTISCGVLHMSTGASLSSGVPCSTYNVLRFHRYQNDFGFSMAQVRLMACLFPIEITCATKMLEMICGNIRLGDVLVFNPKRVMELLETKYDLLNINSEFSLSNFNPTVDVNQHQLLGIIEIFLKGERREKNLETLDIVKTGMLYTCEKYFDMGGVFYWNKMSSLLLTLGYVTFESKNYMVDIFASNSDMKYMLSLVKK